MANVNCSDYPQELSSFLHGHRLILVTRLIHQTETHTCDVCRERIDGTFYRCHNCDFDIHPFCTQLPEHLRHVIDDHHKLTLHKLPSGSCAVCQLDCSSLWVYGCGVCRVNIHLKCVLQPYGQRRSDNPAVPESGSRGIRYGHAPPWMTAQQPHSHGGYGREHSFFGYGFPGGFPNYHYRYPPPPRPNYGGHMPSPSPIWGSIFGGTIVAMVQNLAAGALGDFLFGSQSLFG